MKKGIFYVAGALALWFIWRKRDEAQKSYTSLSLVAPTDSYLAQSVAADIAAQAALNLEALPT